MTGIHSIDVGILIMPVLIETMAYMGDEAGVEYDLGTEKRIDSDAISETQLALVMKKIKDKQGMESEMPVQEEMSPEPVEEPVDAGGLMSRRM